jgi:hypothetical protein
VLAGGAGVAVDAGPARVASLLVSPPEIFCRVFSGRAQAQVKALMAAAVLVGVYQANG